MAEMFNSQVPMELQPEAQAISRQQKMAELLTAKGMQPTPGQTVAGGVYVPTNPMEHIANLYNVYAGSKGLENVEQQQLSLAKAIREGRSASEEQIINAMSGDNPDWAKAAKLITTNDYNAGKELLPQVLKNFAPEQPAAVQEYLYGAKHPEFNQWDINRKLATKPVTNVTVAGETELSKTLGQGMGKKILSLEDVASKANNVISDVNRQREILKGGKLFTGPTANIQQDAALYADALGLGGKDTATKAANTQSMISGAADSTLNAISSSGLGSGQGFTDKDLKFLQDAKSYRVTMNKENISRILDLQEKAAVTSIDKYNNYIKTLPQKTYQTLGIQPIKVQGGVKYLGPAE